MYILAERNGWSGVNMEYPQDQTQARLKYSWRSSPHVHSPTGVRCWGQAQNSRPWGSGWVQGQVHTQINSIVLRLFSSSVYYWCRRLDGMLLLMVLMPQNCTPRLEQWFCKISKNGLYSSPFISYSGTFLLLLGFTGGLMYCIIVYTDISVQFKPTH